MSPIQELNEIYNSFCSFGSNRNLATGTADFAGGEVTMDGAKFGKFAKDTKIVDAKKVTTTDVDIIFNKIKTKGARRIGWDEFQNGFQELADKKYPGKSPKDAFESLLAFVSDKGPIARGTITQANGVYDKLTNTNSYTGTHKNRFDANGVGLGGAGRQTNDNPTGSLSQLTNRETNFAVPNNTFSGPAPTNSVGAAKKRGQTHVVTASTESLDLKANQPKRADQHKSNSSLNGSNMSMNKTTTKSSSSINKTTSGSTGSLNGNNRPASRGEMGSSNFTTTKINTGPKGSVFDRLTNVNGYTGAHKERFNTDGSGKGLNGRQTIDSKTANLSQIVNRS
jgi:hypothetical protein